jgi:DNA repair protein RAD50
MKELVRVQDELDSIDVDAAKKASRRYEQDYERMRSDLGKNQSEEARLGGEIATMEEDRKEKMNELETEYKDIYVRFNTQLISNSVGRFFAHFLHPAPLTGGFIAIADNGSGQW